MTHDNQNAENMQPEPIQNDSEYAPTNLEKQLEQAKSLAAEHWDKYLRTAAELDNFRKRQEKSIADRVLMQKKKILHNLLSVMDNIDRALAYQETLDRETAVQMLKLVSSQLHDVIKSEGVQVIPSVGEQFDPHLHEAIETVPSAEHPEGTVVEEALKGYMLDEETLRPARVKVSAKQDDEQSSTVASQE